MSDHLRLKPNKLRRFALERAVTLAVVTGGSLVLLAIASIFLFLAWQSAPLWLDKTVLQSAKHLTDTRFEAPAPLSDRRLLVRETATQRNGILSLLLTEWPLSRIGPIRTFLSFLQIRKANTISRAILSSIWEATQSI